MLAIIPARGGSEGVRRKNLRIFDGVPLVVHKARQLEAMPEFADVIVSTDDEQIASVCRLAGLNVQTRPDVLAGPAVPIERLAKYVVTQLEWEGPVGVFQCTCPTVSTKSIRDALTILQDGDVTSVSAAVADDHILWTDEGLLRPRVNRQYQKKNVWRETGAFQMVADPTLLVSQGLVTDDHQLYVLPADEAHDIDTHDDLEAARFAHHKTHLRFVVIADKEHGSGHWRRCLQLADELSHHDIVFAVMGDDDEHYRFACETIQADGYPIETSPPIVGPGTIEVMDCLGLAYPLTLRYVSLEDLNPGTSGGAAVIFNELYEDARPNAMCGPRFAVVRPEFLAGYEYNPKNTAILVSFGGTDPRELQAAVVTQLSGWDPTTPDDYATMAEAMADAAVLITSAGRTVNEAAAMGLPVISVPVNPREETHVHVPGVVRVGPEMALDPTGLADLGIALRSDMAARMTNSRILRSQVDGLGARRIARIIDGIAEGL